MQRILVEDIGIVRQWELYQEISEVTRQRIPVIDAAQVLKDPATVLSSVCQCLDIPFLREMLNWPRGRRESDGVWAPHWYQVVEQSTGFAPYQAKSIDLTDEQQAVAEASMTAYAQLLACK